jgi:hypothetical protein
MRKVKLLLVFLSFSITVFADGVFDYGFYLRLRQEYVENVFDFNKASIMRDDNYFRLKASVWGKWNFSDDVNMFVKLTTEPKYYLSTTGQMSGGKELKDQEIFFDNLYLDVKNAFGMPVDLRLGRQDFLMTHGEGFLIMDGTPSDGGRSLYFNAAKATLKFDEKNSLDIIYTQNTYQDEYLPLINDQDRNIIYPKMDERAVILYGKFKVDDNLSVEPYYIHKIEDAHTRAGNYIEKLKLNTVGKRAVYNFAPWSLRGELAYQFGEYDDNRDRSGLGGYIFLKRAFTETKLSPTLDIGYAYLSGDGNPYAGDKDKGWNPLFSKWPWLSELYVFHSAIERGEVGYWTNLQIWRAKTDMKMTDKTGFCLAYNYLRANDNPAPAVFFGTGKERGHLGQVQLTHKFNKNIDGLLLLEYFKPGNFYASDRDNALFFRWQLQMNF